MVNLMRRVTQRWMKPFFDFQAPNAGRRLRLDAGYQRTRIELTEDSFGPNQASGVAPQANPTGS